jgi:hypothetical protein
MTGFAKQRAWTDLLLREQGFRRVGPKQMCCQLCDVRISTNALARASHLRSRGHRQALASVDKGSAK